jgi:hypothetical protein
VYTGSKRGPSRLFEVHEKISFFFFFFFFLLLLFLYLCFFRYAHENGCEWNADVCDEAENAGNLECLRYAYENGCPWPVEDAERKLLDRIAQKELQSWREVGGEEGKRGRGRGWGGKKIMV